MSTPFLPILPQSPGANPTPAADPNAPGKDVDMHVFSFLGAMMDTATVMMQLLSDTTNAITTMMQISNNLIGPLMSKWQIANQLMLQNDASQINSSDPQTQANFNVDNATVTSTNTTFGNLANMVSQQITTQTSNYQNQQQLAQTVAVGLSQSIAQNWVI